MDNDHSNKRLKSASGAAIKINGTAAANLAAYQPPAAVKQHNSNVIG